MIQQSRMNETSSSNDHELNGYKYSFSRVNPYLTKTIQSLTHLNPNPYPSINHNSQLKNNIKQLQSLSSSKQKLNKPQQHSINKIPLIQEKLKPLHLKHLKQLTTHKNTLNHTERLLYEKFQQNDKNKALIGLYLKNNNVKTNFSKKLLKNKLKPIRCDDNTHTTTKQQHNFIQGQDKQLTFPLMSDLKCPIKHSTQQKHRKHSKTHRHSSTSHHSDIQLKDKQNYLLIIDSSELPDDNNQSPYNHNYNSNSIKQKQRTITEPTTRMKCKNDGNQIKLLRNFNSLKFLAYLPPTKQYTKIKHSTSQTTPVNKFSQFTLLNETLNKNNKVEVRKNIGAVKYKSPRIIMSSKNKKLLNRKQISPKMKLFTEQEQNSIIKEFYSEEENNQQ